MAWFNSSWQYRKKITVDHTLVVGPLINFPLLVKTTDADIGSKALANGDDILFTRGDGETKLPHEIEKFDNVTGDLVAHVRIVNLPDDVDSEIYVYYGNALSGNQENKIDIWNGDYKGVYHFAEDPGSVDLTDSTINDLTVFPVGMDAADLVPTPMGFGNEYDGVDDYAERNHTFPTFTKFTLEIWVSCDDWTATSEACNSLTFGDIADAGGQKIVPVLTYSPDPAKFFMRDSTGASAALPFVGSEGMINGMTYYFVITWDQATAITRLYWEGLEVYSQTGFFDDPVNCNFLSFGRVQETGGAWRYHDGILDEFRWSALVRSPEWIETSYNNQGFPSTFCTFDSEEEEGAPPSVEFEFVSGGSGTTSWTMDVGTPGTFRLVTVNIGDETSTNTFTGVTIDGKTATLIHSIVNTDGLGNVQEMYYLDEDGLGSSSGVVTIAIQGGDAGAGGVSMLHTGVASGVGPSDTGFDNSSAGVDTITVSGIDSTDNALIVGGYGQGSAGLSLDSLTSPLIERADYSPSSAQIFGVSGVETTGQSNKSYVADHNTNFNRGTGIIAVFPQVVVEYTGPNVNQVSWKDAKKINGVSTSIVSEINDTTIHSGI